ncbi:FtsK/SpoIIIE family protein [Saccharopolyspora erythraea NRRL 2338]|uniref:Cell divisionFtsK/SpoIIIE n=2 Tax=Saccharopolyspora erythraea TaxID=1836 RepID=A4F7I7_SACEN|nr:FtsK/SpoIIIE domain-containing protein [Saccharopolyspora erythraea]EQD84266.1 cell division protein FtsK [Saccharopolyspora erythraea D]PFG93813.1 FtsK/SpoIIIE family protein [Saccharopolyspora erythraea NRRL 2338]QRK90646.1 cell division protein FtsK [Saccharopolyspora erythraea]CAM00011.1 cell divisionFtsK/SpoIIIE [Saccharopolyspora erythraea NRRL 2338]
MRKRNERRSRIEAAFARLRSSVATALGAAENERRRIHADCAQREFALRIAQIGVAEAARDPSRVEGAPSPAFDAAMTEATLERDEIYAEWTASGPVELTALTAAAAPGSAGRPWEEWLGWVGTADLSSPAPELWHIGTAEVPDSPAPQPFPAAVPLLDESHLRITTRPGTRETAEALVQNLLLRVLGHFQPGLVRVHVWDVAQLTGTLPGLYPLTRAGLLTAHDPTRLDEMLEALSDHIRRIHTSALLGGHTSLRALAAETGHRSEPWRIAVLFGDGQPLREEQQQQLQRIARNGLACGIQLVIVDLPLTVNSAIESVTLIDPDRARCSMTGPEAVIRLEESPPGGTVTKACSAVAEAFLARRARVRTFEDLVPEQLWTQRSTSGLHAPVGFSEGEPVWVTLGDASPHTLIGGPSGSGKTNFLYGMLGGMAARYSPDELELYLLDFKEGVSFAQFTPGKRDPSWLPHAQLVGVNVNADREFGLALLRFLSAEMRRRADAAKAHEVTKLEELRAEDPDGRWPRIVAVIDEFQYLFAERDTVSSQATTLLEDVARRGRSQGIHLVLASQDVSGIEAFWGKPAIFEQFILRIALPKARRVLTEQNTAAMELPRWHAVINHESGVKHGNEIARIPDATAKHTFDDLQLKLWERRDPAAAPPRLFDGSHLPSLAALGDYRGLRPTGAAPKALLGQVIDVDGTAAAVELARSPGRNIAVIGSVRVDAASVLGAAALSLARQHEPGGIRFTVAELVDEAHEDVRALVGALRDEGHEVEVVGLDGIEAAVASLADTVDQRSASSEAVPVPHCLLLYAADAAQTVLERKDPQTRASALDHLRKVLKQGPELRIHVIGWWRSAQRVKNTLGMGPVDDIGAWVAFDVHGQELQVFAAGQVVNWSPRARRGLFFDRSKHSRPEVVLPFDLAGTAVPEVPAQRSSDQIWEEADE